jgi:hydrogenase-4 component E
MLRLSSVNLLLVGVLLLNLFMLGTSRIRGLIQAAALQGVVLGAILFLMADHSGWNTALLAIATVVLKGSLIPRMLRRALREAQIKREVEPLIGFVPTMLLGAVGTLLSIAFASGLPLAPQHRELLIVPASFSTVVTGFILLTTRIKAITQAIGYLVLENGIFIFGMLLVDAMPFLVEIGVLLDVFVGIFVVSIIIHHIQREFASLDTRRLASLKE